MSAPRVLVADDEQGMREFLRILLKKEGYEVALASSGREALELASAPDPFDLLISDIRMPDLTGIDLLREIKSVSPETPVFLITAYASTQTAIAALKLGAFDYLTKPFDVEEFKIVVRKALERSRLQRENASLKRQLRSHLGESSIIGRSPALKAVLDLVARVADTPATVLLTGERGTGKELLARAIHAMSSRSKRRFVSVNCAAIQESLLESELFGHVRGSFTGATSAHEGLFAAADGGTILLDEVGEMSPNMQAKLLRVLQEKTIRRVGGNKETSVDVRIIASTNRDLDKDAADGSFRADLYDRLNVIRVEVPALRDRREDVPLLVEHFIQAAAAEMKRAVVGIEPEALRALEQHDWPGNVRELENVCRRAVALESTEQLRLGSLPREVVGAGATADDALPEIEEGFVIEDHLEERRAQLIRKALAMSGGKRVEAARILGMTFRALRYYIKKYELDPKSD